MLQEAVRTSDRELFSALLDKQDPNWWEIQQLLFSQNLFLDRAPLGLWATVAPTAVLTVTLSPDLITAEVVEQLPYKTQSGEVVHLQQTAVYQRKNGSWLLVPIPDPEQFWGVWQETENGRFTLFYPTRDQVIGKRLANDLGQLVAQLCTHPEIQCPPGHLEVRLGGDSYRLEQLNYVPDLFPTTGYNYIVLPTPTLVGQPVDEAGYQALYRGYANWIATAMLVRFTPQQSFTRDWLIQTLSHYQLQPPALPGTSHQAQSPPPLLYPDQDVQLLCINNSIGRLLRYLPHNQTWHDEPTDNLFITPFITTPMIPLADDRGVLLQMQVTVTGTPHWRTVVLVNGRTQLVLDEEQHYNLLPWLQSSAETAESYLHFSFTNNAQWSVIASRLLDLDQCGENGCTELPVNGRLAWSPDQQHTLVQPLENPLQLLLGNPLGQETVEIGTGWSPFWLDNTAFGYVRQADNTQEEVVTAVFTHTHPITISRSLLQTADLLKLLAEEAPTTLHITSVLPHPTQQDWLFLTAVSDTHFYLFQFDRRSGVLFLFRQLARQTEQFPQVSLTENGRFLVLAIPQTTYPHWYINVHDLSNSWLHTYPAPFYDPRASGFDWSADGEWLVIPNEGFLRLIAPAYNYEQPIFHHITNCSSVAWVNKKT